MSSDPFESSPADESGDPPSADEGHSSQETDEGGEPCQQVGPGPVLETTVVVPQSQSDTGPQIPDAPPMEWLHPTSLIFDVIAHGRTYIVPAIIALFSAASGNWGGIWFAAIFFVPAITVSIIRFFTLRFVIRNHELIVTEGLLFRKARAVPVSRIQNVDLVQNVLHRLIGVAEVRVETASGTEPEAVLRVLSQAKIESLRKGIFSSRDRVTPEVSQRVSEPTIAASPDGSVADANDGETILKIPTRWLVRAGLTSNRGFVLVGVLVGLYFQFDQDFEQLEKFKVNRITEWLSQNMGVWAQVLIASVAALIFLLILRLVGIAWFLLRFHGYQLVRQGEDLRISCGLFTKVSATVPIRRIQFVSVHQNLFMRFLKMASIRIETAGGAGKESESATATVARRWFIPVLPMQQVSMILSRLRADLDWRMDELDWQSLAPRAGTRLVRIALIQSMLLILFGTVFALFQAFYLQDQGGQWWPFSAAVGWAMAPLFVLHAIKTSRSKKYARTDYGVVYQSGIFTRKTSMTFFEKIQTLRVDQSPFDRRWKMARLSIDTAAAGPADHLISVPYLDAAFVNQEFAELHRKSAFQQPRFG